MRLKKPRHRQVSSIDIPSLSPVETPVIGEPATIRAELVNNFAGPATFTIHWVVNGMEVDVHQVDALETGESVVSEIDFTPTTASNEACVEIKNLFVGLDKRSDIGPVCDSFTAEGGGGNGNGNGGTQDDIIFGMNGPELAILAAVIAAAVLVASEVA